MSSPDRTDRFFGRRLTGLCVDIFTQRVCSSSEAIMRLLQLVAEVKQQKTGGSGSILTRERASSHLQKPTPISGIRDVERLNGGKTFVDDISGRKHLRAYDI